MSEPLRTVHAELRAFLVALAGPAMPGSLMELRTRHRQLMRRRFIPTEQPDQAVRAILRAGRERDVYVGAAPRALPRGGRTAIAVVSTLWIDADTEEAIARLDAFEPEPAIVVATGRGRHAYWLLDHPVAPQIGEQANRRLAFHLHADGRCADAPRILRPPHTMNFGYDPARPVRLLRLRSQRRPLEAVTGALPTEAPPPSRQPAVRDNTGDPLLAIDPPQYVHSLLGRAPGRDHKLSCPFHEDLRPSFHVYATPAEGWHCFSCGRGGSVYDLGAALWELEPRGRKFLLLRRKLRSVVLGEAS